ncbi:MAG: hypothetical protein K6L76_02765 [Agarilytica sp.]
MYKLSLIFLIFLTSTAYGAPSVNGLSGAITDGNSLVLSGTGFGNHDLDIEFLGGNDGAIENMALGRGSSFGNWILGDGSGLDTYVQVINDASVVRSGSKAWFFDMPSDGKYAGSARFDYGRSIPEDTPIYISWWVRKDWGNHSGQWKMFRLAYQNNIQDQGTELMMSNWTSSNLFLARPGDNYNDYAMTYYGNSGAYPSENNVWYRMEMLVTTSTQGNKDGHVDIKIHDTSTGEIRNTSFSFSGDTSPYFPNIYTYNVDKRYRWFLWQNYRGNGMDNLKVWMDDMYVQVGTHKRIELCDSATWSNCSSREIQKPTQWSDNAISVNLNRGGFKNDAQQYYLYVVDENNNPSNAYPISFSGNGNAPPYPPASLQIQSVN